MAHSNLPPEIEALGIVLQALKPLDEAERAFVLKTAAERFELKPPETQQSSRHHSKAADRPDTSPKAFLKEKAPKTELQQVVCLAYFLTHFREQASFKTRDLTSLNIEAAGSQISNATRAIQAARENYDLLSSAGKAGLQITTKGEDLIEALPDQGKAKEALATAKRRKKSVPRKAK